MGTDDQAGVLGCVAAVVVEVDIGVDVRGIALAFQPAVDLELTSGQMRINGRRSSGERPQEAAAGKAGILGLPAPTVVGKPGVDVGEQGYLGPLLRGRLDHERYCRLAAQRVGTFC